LREGGCGATAAASIDRDLLFWRNGAGVRAADRGGLLRSFVNLLRRIPDFVPNRF
jgi:hypothetical protein